VKSEVIASPSHVLCRVPDVSNQFIETTCPECHSTSDEPTSEHRGQHAQSEALRVISDAQLIGKVFYNRGVAELEAKHYAKAADLLVAARKFDREDQAARDNLLATLNNWALAACDAKDYQSAARLISRGLSIDVTYPPFQSNDLHIHQQWVKSLCSQRHYARAIEVLNIVIERHPEATPFVQGRLGVYGKWAETLFVDDEFTAAWAALDQAKRLVTIADETAGAKLAEVEFAAVVGASEKLIQSGRTDQNRKLIREAIERKPEHADLLRRKLDLLQSDL
jgi:tetratricopeptide (TPR) repeat protein